MPNNKALGPFSNRDWLPASEFIAKPKPIELAREGNTIIVPASVWLPRLPTVLVPGEAGTYKIGEAKPLPSMPSMDDVTLSGGMVIESVVVYRDTGNDGTRILRFLDPKNEEEDE